MKIGTIVLAGAAGLALAGAAQADRFVASTPLVSINGTGALNMERTWTATPEGTNGIAERPSVHRDHRRLQAAKAEIDALARAGVEIDPSRLLYIEGGNDREAAAGRSKSGVVARTDLDTGSKFDFFDGFQTYNLGNLGGQSNNSPLTGNVGGTFAELQVVDAAGETSTSSNDPMSTNLRNPRNPFGMDPYPVGRNPAIDPNAMEKILFDGRVSTFQTQGNPQRMWTLFIDDGLLYVPTSEKPLIAAIDAYYNNYELFRSVAPVSFTEGFILTRLLDAGRWETSAFTTNTGGILDRPAVLGQRPGSFGFGQFFATPLVPRDSMNNTVSLPRFQSQTGEWFTYAFALTTQGLSVYVRNSITDGSGSVLIEDPAPADPMFASGWYRAFPGRQADELSPGVWTGYGRAENEFGQVAEQTPVYLAGGSYDGMIGEWFTIGIPEDEENWNPTGAYWDNNIIIGDILPTPPVPKRRLPYKDDMELYFEGGPVALIPGWFDALSSRAVVAFGSFNGSSVNASPSPGSDGGTSNQSIAQRNVIGDNAMRSEFDTATPVGAQRPYAIDGNPVTVSANIRMTSIQTVRGMQIIDANIEGLAEFLMFSSVNTSDNIVPRFMIRRQNPFFVDTEPTSASARIFEYPIVDNNTFNLNFPTNQFITPLTDAGGSGGAFFNAAITFNGDGTAYWSVNGNRLTFFLDTGVFTSGQIDELEAAFEEAQMTAGEPVGAPYSLFLTDMFTLNEVAFWSGNQDLGFNDRIFVDDVCVDGFIRTLAPGPSYELPFCEDFENYFLDQSIAGHGATPFAAVGDPAGAGVNIQQRSILAAEDDSLGDGSTEWCSYTVLETFDGDMAWGITVGDVLYVRVPAVTGFDCPERPNIPTIPNLTLIDSDEMGLDPFPMRVGSPSEVMGDGSAADIRATYPRFDSEAVFCRYEILSIDAEDDPMAGGAPYSIPTELSVGNVVAITNPFSGDCVTLLNTMGDSIPINANFALFEDEFCIFATASLLLLNPPSMARTGTPDPDFPPVTALDSDVRGWGINITPVALWGGFFASDIGGVVRVGQAEMDDVLAGSIDPMGDRGNVLAYFNSGVIAPLGTTGGIGGAGDSQNTINVPTVVGAAATSEATEITGEVCWDYYIQDNNTRIIAQVNGPRFDAKGAPAATAPVIRVRFGGPPLGGATDPIATDTEIAVQIQIPGMLGQPAQPGWMGTGVPRPTGQWFTSCVEVDLDGNWSLTVDGNPVASGASVTQPEMGLTVPMGVANLQFRSGWDEEGTDAPEVTATVVRSLGEDAVRPGGNTADQFCFYEIQSIITDNVMPTATFHPVNAVNGDALLDGMDLESRVINASDTVILAVRFFDGGGLINEFGDCPTTAGFQVLDGADMLIGEGTWFLTGRTDIDFPADAPSGGIVNAGGPAGNDKAYNFENMFDGNQPYRNILLCEAVELPVFGAPGIASQWWVDDIKVEALGGDPTAPPCPWDLTGSGSVGSADLGFLLGCWGPITTMACEPADFTSSNAVGSADLAALLGNWGPCPE